MSWALGSDHSVNVLKYIFVRKYVKRILSSSGPGQSSYQRVRGPQGQSSKQIPHQWLSIADTADDFTFSACGNPKNTL